MTTITSEDLWRISLIVITIWTINGIVIFLLLTRVDTIVNVQLYEYGLQFSNAWADPYWSSTYLIVAFLAIPIALSSVVFVLGLTRFVKKIPKIFKRKAKQQKAEAKEKAQVPIEKDHMIPVFEVDLEHEQIPKPPNTPQPEMIQPEIVQVEQESEPETVEVYIESKEEKRDYEEPKAKEDPGHDETCPNCGKVFSRPLVMLGFTNGKARLLNICPFCNHILGEALDMKKKDEKSEG